MESGRPGQLDGGSPRWGRASPKMPGGTPAATSTDSASRGCYPGPMPSMTSWRSTTSPAPVCEDSTPAALDPQYDEVGNLIFDGTYYYQYDAWNRLIRVIMVTTNY